MQLDLFTKRDAPKPVAIIFRFPLDRRVDLIRATAAELRNRSYGAGKRFWAAHVQSLRREMRGSGIRREAIDLEIRAYSQAVRREVFAAQPVRISR